MGRGEYYRNKYGGGGRGRGGGRGVRGGGGYEDDVGYGNRTERSPRGSHSRQQDWISGSNHRNNNLRKYSWFDLQNTLRDINNRNYGAYHELENIYIYQEGSFQFELEFDHIQGDPYASPSRAHVQVDAQSAGFSSNMYASRIRNVALCDYLTRQFAMRAREVGADAKTASSSWHGAKGGDISIDAPGQHVIERSSVMISDDGTLEARFNINLPARGRSICGEWAKTILVDTLPLLVKRALICRSLHEADIWNHLLSIEDQEVLRNLLKSEGLVGFIRDGGILPRESGASDKPLSTDKAIPFQSPSSLRKTFTLPNRGTISGMGIPIGITLFVGGGFHGKTTVLKALEVGIYNHIPGDGREFVVIDPTAVKIRSEDSRSVMSCDISPFIDNLPFKQDTTNFSTTDASGSTSQAANIMEALEIGAKTLLIDEDTCATNFMIRDGKMQQLVAKEKEPITPFISKVRALLHDHEVSCILVIGGAGDYFYVADHVIMMDCYEPKDVTQEAKQIAHEHAQDEIRQENFFGSFRPRIPIPKGFEVNGKIVTRGINRIQFGDVDLDLIAVEQIVETSQVRAIADAILKARSFMNGKRTLRELVDLLEEEMDRSKSLDVISIHKKSGFYTRPRKYEIAAAINRLRTATIITM